MWPCGACGEAPTDFTDDTDAGFGTGPFGVPGSRRGLARICSESLRPLATRRVWMCPADLADCADFLLLRICEPFGVGSRDSADDVGTTSKDLTDKQLVAAALRIF